MWLLYHGPVYHWYLGAVSPAAKEAWVDYQQQWLETVGSVIPWLFSPNIAMRTQAESGVLSYIVAHTSYRLIEVSRASVTITDTDSFTKKIAFYGPLRIRLQIPSYLDARDI